MKANRILAGLFAVTVCLSMMAGCSGSTAGQNSKSDQSGAKSNSNVQSSTDTQSSSDVQISSDVPEKPESTGIHTLYIRDAGKSPEITATFSNNVSGKTQDIPMKKVSESDDHFLFSCDADVTAYNMVHLTYGEQVSADVTFNSFVSGWYLINDDLLPYTKGKEPSYSPKYETKVFPFNGYDKEVYIWTPDDYDAKAAEKYSTIYMMDGQTVLTSEMGDKIKCWNISEHVDSMMSVTDNKAIIVAINTGDEHRSEELIPDLEVSETPNPDRHGKQFADYICDTIMPYITENYNVYTDPAHTFVGGSSLGGLASFYIGMEHPDKFGAVGALSPSFWTDEADTWIKYLTSKKFGESSPFIYMYAGGYYADSGIYSLPMYQGLISLGYPKDKIVFSKYEPGEHSVPFWRSIYPEFLEAAFTKNVSALECGGTITYIDTTNHEELPDVSVKENDDRPASITNYVFFDNSQTKWEHVYAYWWKSDIGVTTNKITGEEYGAPWPGLEMEQVEGTDIYKIVVPMGANAIIFDSGVSDDDVKKGVEAYQTMDLIFRDDINYGQIFTIDTTQAPKRQRGFEKTKFKYPAGSWSDYTG